MGKPFRSQFSENVFYEKYAWDRNDTWNALSKRVVSDVCGWFQGKADPLLSLADRAQLCQYISEMKFIPGGRYLRYAGRPMHAWNNCYLLRAEEDTREEWGALLRRASDCLMSGGGIGGEYSRLRPRGSKLGRTGGVASGPVPLMGSVNDMGRNVMQGGWRRAAIWAGLNWRHQDVWEFMNAKNWHTMPVGRAKKSNGEPYTIRDAKFDNFNFPAPLDYTNISVGYDNAWLAGDECHRMNPVFMANVSQALSTGEPGFSFNFGLQENENLRNACTEVTSEDDSDVCNLGSINLSRIDSLNELAEVVYLASQFLVCGTVRATLPYEKVYKVREKNRRLGLGLMGLHEWLLKRGCRYEMTPELGLWLLGYQHQSETGANYLCDRLGISRPVAYRAIAPTGTIGIMAGTTTGIEPLYAVAYKRRYLSNDRHWKYEYVVDGTADYIIRETGADPESIETASSLAADPERRVKFQSDVQDYVDMAISSTINLPAWGSEGNNPDKVKPFAEMLSKYAPRLRGFTCYPDGSRGGQPITQVPYLEAVKHKDVVYDEVDICDLSGHGGTCGI